MISPELLVSAAPDAVGSTWPDIMDLDEIQAGGCLAFWEKVLPGSDPEDVRSMLWRIVYLERLSLLPDQGRLHS